MTKSLLCFCLICLLTAPVGAQSIDELKAKLEARKAQEAADDARAQQEEAKAQAKRQADADAAERARLATARELAQAQAVRSAAEAETARLERERLAAEAQLGTLLIRSNRDCALSVNATEQGQLAAGETRSLSVKAGDQLIECVASARARFDTTVQVSAGLQAVAILDVPADARFIRQGEDVADYQSNLLWTARDNGAALNFADAEAYCAARDMTLPSVAALQALTDTSGAFKTEWKFNGAVYELNPATDLITIGSCCFWSGESKNENEAYYVGLGAGSRLETPKDKSDVLRALCVRPL